MKTHRSRGRWPVKLVAWMLVAGLLMVGVGVMAVAAGPSYVPNEYIVKAARGSTLSAVDQAIAQAGGVVVKPLPLTDTYLVRLGVAVKAGLTMKARSLASQWVIQSFSPNYIYHANAVPNDPLFSLEWNMGLINLPQAWNTQKGSASVTVAVLDTGVANHPELEGRIVQGFDFVNNVADASNDTDGHGTFVAGILAAQGDNNVGICGVCWNGVNIMPVRVLGAGGGTTAQTIQGLDFAMVHKADVINMSFGGLPGVPDAAIQAKVTEVAAAGIIMVACAGNDGMSIPTSVETPALCPEVIAVSAVGPNDEFAYYSSYGPGNEVDIAAPGGDDLLGPSAMITSLTVTWDQNNVPTFDYGNVIGLDPLDPGVGTSFAAPHVSGAAALLLSAGVPPGDVRSRLESSARKPRTGTMDKRKYGAGILDVGAALANGSVLIAKPVKGSTVTDTPDFKINVRGIDYNSLEVYLDYADGNQDDLPDDLSSETPILAGRAAIVFLNAAQTFYAFNWSQLSDTPLSSGLHFIYVRAKASTGDVYVSDWGTFSVSSRVIPAGTYLISLPYGSSMSPADGLRHPLPQELLWDASTSQPLDFRPTSPGRARLIRWSAPEMSYLAYTPGSDGNPATNDRSWVNLVSPRFGVPTGGGFLPSDPSTVQFPAGSGFWLILQRDAVLSNTFPDIAASGGFNIFLYRGWNLIGNPYTHPIPISSIKLLYQGKIRTLEEDGSSSNPWVQPLFYGYSTEGISGYVAVPSRGVLEAFQGYWLRALVGGNSSTSALLMNVQ